MSGDECALNLSFFALPCLVPNFGGSVPDQNRAVAQETDRGAPEGEWITRKR